MNHLFVRLLVVCAGVWLVSSGAAQPANGVYREVYLNIAGSSIPNLTNAAVYPNSPSTDDVVVAYFEAPANWADSYGTRMRGLITPPSDGNYTFWISSDDNSELWLSTDATPATRRMIARVTAWTGTREWTKEANQQSAPVTLVGGQQYYIEALMKEGTGGDNLAVRWQLPNGAWESADANAPIPGTRLKPYGIVAPQFATQPTNVVVVEGSMVTFSATVVRHAGVGYQWRRNGSSQSGATNNTYTIGPVALWDSGAIFACVATNWVGTNTTTNAILTVVADVVRPTISGVANLGNNQLLTVVFSEDVEAQSATNHANYAIDQGVSVLGAIAGPDNRTVILTTTPMSASGTYTLTVNNVRDRASTPNTILPNSQRQFRLAPVPLPITLLKPQPEPIGPSTRKGPLVISEIMYHPTNRTDGKNIEFIEVYNTMPWFEELGGFKISGAIEYTFPSNFVLGARSFVVVAKVPADVQSVYGTTGVLGPWTGSLENSSGMVRLHNHLGAILFETEYSGDAPWPLASDGAGHSLVLARPSFGEADPRAWSASDVVGGTPGTNEVLGANLLATFMINEVLANTELPELDYVELHNYSTNGINISGCVLTDDPTTNKFVFPVGTILPAGGFLVVYETNLNFGLSSSGEELYLKNPTGSRVLDCVRFGPQENGVPLGRFPDGAQSWSRLSAKTPGTNNAALLPSSVVINEIMYHPASDVDDDEYVELFNPNTNAVDVSEWRLDDAVKFTIPANTIIPARGFLVIADNALRLRTIYPSLTPWNCIGDWNGKLNNSSERIALLKPVTKLTTNGAVVTTNTLRVTVDEVTYGSAGRWGRWSDGGGSSLELRDWRGEHRAAPSWADSNESGKSPWINIENTTTLAHGNGTTHQLHITLMGAGECLIDNVEVIFNGVNQVTNWTFEFGTTDWTFQGNHNETSWEMNEGYNSWRSLHIRATGRGDTGANRIRVPLSGAIGNGSVVTLRAKVRWLKGNPNILLRIRGNGTELARATLAANALGTPAAQNTAFTTNAPPTITDVMHWPPVPAQTQPVTVTARVYDPDGIATLLVRYRVDPSANYSSLVMSNNGAGMFSATIPPQGTNIVAFYVVAVDRFNALSTFPNNAPTRECVVKFGDAANPGTLPTYRFWVTQANIDRWVNEERMSNKPKDVTFVYGTNRVVYNAGAWFHGSPYHSPAYNSPVGNACDYDMNFPGDDTLLGETDINLYRPGNGGGDVTGQREIHAYWFGYQMGTPFLFHRPVFVMVNGQRRETIYHDAQQPNGDFGRQWYPEDADGELHKIKLGFEFGDMATGASDPGYAVVGANFGRYTYPDGSWHVPRYRETLPLRSVSPTQQNDYTNLYGLITAVNTPAAINTDAYTIALTNMTDVEEWYRVNVVQHLYENTDSFSYGGGQNAFTYKPARSTWKLLLWDVDFAFGSAGTDTNLFNIGGAQHGPRNDHAPFRRIYWQVLLDAANSILTQARSFPILDARYNGMVASGAAVASPAGMKTFIDGKRALVLSNLATVACPWTITTSNGADFSIGTNYVTLSGTAPIDVRTIEINGFTYPLRWTSITNWTLTVALDSGTNTLSIVGRDKSGAIFGSSSNTIRVNVTVPVPRAEDSIVINEIMYNPRVENAEYVELFNRSTNTSFDLAGWRLDGVGYTFPGSAVLGPRQYLVLVKDRIAYTNAYGASAPTFDSYSGTLQGNGELLTLVKPGPTTNSDVVIDKVRYDNNAPWPLDANNTGSSVQLADAAQDNSRVGNWRATYKPAVMSAAVSTPARTHDGWRFVSVTNTFGSNNRLMIYPDQAASVNFDDFYLTTNGTPETGKNFIGGGDFEAATLTTNWSIGTNILAYTTTNLAHGGARSGFFLWTNSGSSSLTNKDLVQLIPPPLPANGQPCVLSFWYYVTNTTPVNYTVRLIGSAINFTTNLYVYYEPSNYIPPQVISPEVASRSPGAANTLATNLPAFPTVWINEVQAENLTGIRDSASERDPWIEIYNAGTNNVSLDGLYLANNYTNLTQWLIPTGVVIGPKQFKLIFVDGQTNQGTLAEPHAPFQLANGAGSIALTRITTGLTQVVDYVNYTIGPDHSYGSFPDGQPFHRQEFFFVTPSATNNGTLPPITVYINEWMADNATTLADPADGDFEDWFEIYNPGSNTVSLAGYYLSDSLTNKTQFLIPGGYTIPPGGHLLVWADSESGQNNGSRPDLHVNFSLAKGGDTIALFTPDGIQVDAVVFTAQTTDVSRGRFPDGTTTFYSMTNPTPRAANFYPLPNTPPTLAPIADITVLEGSLVSFTATATDSNIPAQQLTFSLISALTNVTIDPASGNFVWQTSELDGGKTNLVSVRVTDNGTPPMSATQSFNLAVIESNTPPQLASVANQSVIAGDLLTFTATATDSDNPPQSLTYLLDASAPAGAEIDSATGVFSWTPSNAQAPAVYQVTIRARDNGSPQLEDSVVVTITVNQAAQTAPLFEPISVTNGVVVLPWQSLAGRTYRLEFKSSLDTNWTTMTNIIANSTTTVVTDELGTNVMRFYRLGLLP